MKTISYLRIEIKPHYKERLMLLETKVVYSGKKITAQVTFEPDDFKSNFDMFMDEAKRLIKQEIKEITC